MTKRLHVHPKLNKGYGWRPGLPSQHFALYDARVEAAALPRKVDLRPECPPVYDQGELGSCTAHAWAGAIEFLFKKQILPDFTPSRLAIYYYEREREYDVAEDAGASLTDGAHVVSQHGCPHEDLWPYDITKFAVEPPAPVAADGLKHLAFGVQQVRQNLTTMKAVLASGLLIPIGFTVYESFESDRVANTGIVPMPGHHEKVVGGHAVDLAGYDDSLTSFIVRNSWGTRWGQDGYFQMPYAYLTNPRLASDFWSANRTE
jgi:C1A family cysteine protease